MTKETNKVFRHVLPLQIRFNDIDKFGHVNNTVHFQFYDTAKTDYFASVCTDVDWEQVAIVVVKIEVEFLGRCPSPTHGAISLASTTVWSEDCRNSFNSLFCRLPLFPYNLLMIAYDDAPSLFHCRHAADGIGMPTAFGTAAYRPDGC